MSLVLNEESRLQCRDCKKQNRHCQGGECFRSLTVAALNGRGSVDTVPHRALTSTGEIQGRGLLYFHHGLLQSVVKVQWAAFRAPLG